MTDLARKTIQRLIDYGDPLGTLSRTRKRNQQVLFIRKNKIIKIRQQFRPGDCRDFTTQVLAERSTYCAPDIVRGAGSCKDDLRSGSGSAARQELLKIGLESTASGCETIKCQEPRFRLLQDFSGSIRESARLFFGIREAKQSRERILQGATPLVVAWCSCEKWKITRRV